MNKFNYIGDGKTNEYYFTFPFFTKKDVVILVNSNPATDYEILCTSAGENADIPFTGGTVIFNKAPKTTDTITIYRNLELNRIVDYQPTALMDTKVLNQDMNFMIEILKDTKSELSDFAQKYSDITDQESANMLVNKIDAVTSAIDGLGDITAIHSAIATLNNSVQELNTSLATATSNLVNLNNFKNGVFDYVIETQTPNASNNYTWYRKYKSGWIEQGGIIKTSETSNQWAGVSVTFPKQMANNMYTAIGTAYGLDSVSTLVVCIGGINENNTDNGTGKGKNSMFIQTEKLHDSSISRVRWIQWRIAGIAS